MDKTADSGSADGGSIPLGYSFFSLQNRQTGKGKEESYGHGKKTKKPRERIPE